MCAMLSFAIADAALEVTMWDEFLNHKGEPLDNDDAFACDSAMKACAASCAPKVDLEDPNIGSCDFWKCTIYCAKANDQDKQGCLAPWSSLCSEIATARLPAGAGPACDVDCSSAYGFTRVAAFITVAATVALELGLRQN